MTGNHQDGNGRANAGPPPPPRRRRGGLQIPSTMAGLAALAQRGDEFSGGASQAAAGAEEMCVEPTRPASDPVGGTPPQPIPGEHTISTESRTLVPADPPVETNTGQSEQVSVAQIPLAEVPAEIRAEWEARTGWALVQRPEDPRLHTAYAAHRRIVEDCQICLHGSTDPGATQIPLRKIPDDILKSWATRPMNIVTNVAEHMAAWLEYDRARRASMPPEPGSTRARLAGGGGHSNTQPIQQIAPIPGRILAADQVPWGVNRDQANYIVGAVLRCPSLWPFLMIGHDRPVMYFRRVFEALGGRGYHALGAVWHAAVEMYKATGAVAGPDVVVDRVAVTCRTEESCIFRMNCPDWEAQLTELTDFWQSEIYTSIDVEDVASKADELLRELLVTRPLIQVLRGVQEGGGMPLQGDYGRIKETEQELEALQHGGAAEDWPEPEPLDGADIVAFPADALPAVLRDWVSEVAETTQVAVDLPAMLAMAVCAAAGAKRVVVNLRPGWSEPINIFTVVVQAPGTRKSAVFRQAVQPLRRFQEEETERRLPEVNRYQSEVRVLKARQKVLEKQASTKHDPEERASLLTDAAHLADELDRLPKVVPPRLIVDDCTPEKLEDLMSEQNGKLLVAAAEGTIFGLMTGRYSDSVQLGTFLSAHSGDDIATDRISRDSVSSRHRRLRWRWQYNPRCCMAWEGGRSVVGRAC